MAFADEEHLIYGVLNDATKQLLFVMKSESGACSLMSIDIENLRKPIIKKKKEMHQFFGKYMILIGEELHVYG